MSRSTVHLKVEFAINEGKADAFESMAQEMIAGSLKEPGTLGYDFFLSSDRKRCRLLETYADADAVLAHITGPVVKELVPKIVEVSRLSGFEVFGDPGPKAAESLTAQGAEIFYAWHLLNR
jgi:quinol monooxygenase YgiN